MLFIFFTASSTTRISETSSVFVAICSVQSDTAKYNIYRLFRREGVANNSQFERNSNTVQTADYGFFDDIPNVAGIDYTQISKAPTPHFIVNTSLNNSAVRQIAIRNANLPQKNRYSNIGFLKFVSVWLR